MRRSIKLSHAEWEIFEQLCDLYKRAYHAPVGKLHDYLARQNEWEKKSQEHPDLARLARQHVDSDHRSF